MANSTFIPRPLGFGRWLATGLLGSGGQGSVYRVIKVEALLPREEVLQPFRDRLTELGRIGSNPDRADPVARSVLEHIEAWVQKPPDSALGAFKEYNIPAGAEGEKARKRLAAEIDALGKLSGVEGVLQLLDASLDTAWIVTDLHSKGSLDLHRQVYRGRALDALRGLRPIVAAVARIHGMGMVHRDIKTANIFVSDDGRLVLGDFGIVFFERDRDHVRVTEELEKVGTRDWMPPWTYTGGRLDDVEPNFDVFSLGKVLWAMLSGRKFLPYWDWDRDNHNLEKLFPNRPEMNIVNRSILKRTIVREPSDCIKDGSELLGVFDEAISALESGGVPIGMDVVRRCRVCGFGKYINLWGSEDRLMLFSRRERGKHLHEGDKLFVPGDALIAKVFFRDKCGHLDFFFLPKGKQPPQWQ